MLRKGPKIHYENIEKQTAPHKRKPKFRSQAQTFKLCAFPYLDLKEVNQQENTPIKSGAETTKRDCLS